MGYGMGNGTDMEYEMRSYLARGFFAVAVSEGIGRRSPMSWDLTNSRMRMSILSEALPVTMYCSKNNKNNIHNVISKAS